MPAAERHRAGVHAEHVQQVGVGVAGGGADVRCCGGAPDPGRQQPSRHLQHRGLDGIAGVGHPQGGGGDRQDAVRRLAGGDRGQRAARPDVRDRPGAGQLDLRLGQPAVAELTQEVPERGRPQRSDHVLAVAHVVSVGEPDVIEGRHRHAEQRGRDRPVGGRVRGQRGTEFDRVADLLARVVPRVERRRVRRVLGRRALRHERQPVGVVVIVQQRRHGGGVVRLAREPVDQDPVEAGRSLVGRDRDPYRHPGCLRGLEVHQPAHPRIHRQAVWEAGRQRRVRGGQGHGEIAGDGGPGARRDRSRALQDDGPGRGEHCGGGRRIPGAAGQRRAWRLRRRVRRATGRGGRRRALRDVDRRGLQHDPRGAGRAVAAGQAAPRRLRVVRRRRRVPGQPDRVPVVVARCLLGRGQLGVMPVDHDLVGVDADPQLACAAGVREAGLDPDRVQQQRRRAVHDRAPGSHDCVPGGHDAPLPRIPVVTTALPAVLTASPAAACRHAP